jgi:hypothetical protein
MSDYPNVSDLIKDNHKKEKKNVIGGRVLMGISQFPSNIPLVPKKSAQRGFHLRTSAQTTPKRKTSVSL